MSTPSLKARPAERLGSRAAPTNSRSPLRFARLARTSLAVLAILATGACASTTAARSAHTARQLAVYEQYAGAPLESFTYLGRYDSWSPLGARRLLLRTTTTDAYLITVLPPCVGLEFALGIRVTSYAHMVTRRIDTINFDHQHCFISQIRRVDYLAARRRLSAPR